MTNRDELKILQYVQNKTNDMLAKGYKTHTERPVKKKEKKNDNILMTVTPISRQL